MQTILKVAYLVLVSWITIVVDIVIFWHQKLDEFGV
jgi:hypothetical protein